MQPKEVTLDGIPYPSPEEAHLLAMMSCLKGGSISRLLARVEKLRVPESFDAPLLKVCGCSSGRLQLEKLVCNS
jgi:hypothetical protein